MAASDDLLKMIASGQLPPAGNNTPSWLPFSIASSDIGSAMPEAYGAHSPIMDPLANSILSSLSLPKRAYETAERFSTTGEYDPGPIIEAAMLPMGTGAIAGVPMRAGEAVLGAGLPFGKPVPGDVAEFLSAGAKKYTKAGVTPGINLELQQQGSKIPFWKAVDADTGKIWGTFDNPHMAQGFMEQHAATPPIVDWKDTLDKNLKTVTAVMEGKPAPNFAPHPKPQAEKPLPAFKAAQDVLSPPKASPVYQAAGDKPLFDFDWNAGKGLWEVFDAKTGKVHATAGSKTAAEWTANQWQKNANAVYEAAKAKEKPSITLPGGTYDPVKQSYKPMERVTSAKPPWLNPNEVLPEPERQAARLAGGYTTPAYRGLRTAEGEELGTVYKGSNMYSSGSPELADLYTSYLSKHPGDEPWAGAYHPGSQVLPLWINTKDYAVADAKGKMWNAFNSKAISDAKKAGKKGVVIHNVWDEPNSTKTLSEPKTIYITFNSKGAPTVKSQFAARFDPTSSDIAKIVGLTAGGAGAGYAMSPGEAQARTPAKPQFVTPASLSNRLNDIMDGLQWQSQWLQRMRLPLSQYADRRRQPQ